MCSMSSVPTAALAKCLVPPSLPAGFHLPQVMPWQTYTLIFEEIVFDSLLSQTTDRSFSIAGPHMTTKAAAPFD